MAKLLLINPSYLRTYGSNQGGIANPVYPILSLAALAGEARQAGHDPHILDLSYRTYDPQELAREIRSYQPDVVGVTATTPLVNQLRDISFLVKDISKSIVTIGGGAHPSSLPRETMAEAALDAVVTGEGDKTIVEILDGRPFSEIEGLYWRDGDEIVANSPRALVPNLDDLAMPAWDLYPIDEYRSRITKIITKYPPLNTIEFSRGCVFKCDFCGSKNTMGLGYRKKSPERCGEEMAVLERLGYREALLTDDIFTSDNNWAIQVCEEISRRDLKIKWTCTNGIRVDSANDKLFKAMKRAGCYRVHFGFESGNDEVLKQFGKGGKATLQQGVEAVRLARQAGLETWGMFMLGLSADTEQTMQDTIRYARRAPVDVKKLGITVPFPGTPMFNDLRLAGRMKTYDWDDYNVYNESSSIFDHPNLSWATIQKYYKDAYMDIYYKNPAYILRRLWRGIRTGEMFLDVYYAVKFFLLLNRKANRVHDEKYGYRDRWEPLSVDPARIGVYEPPKARKTLVDRERAGVRPG